ncbi:lachesin-like [Agrilus planipennis]|uniref:Lachesin-like n=1 Tax=Agrilus planipennis TaxID=224129 RepID=A0A1W4WCX5_AGRPL|nr:lachesin-like [Agrilus planipennis]
MLFKVAWLRVDTQTILTIHGHVITKNHRVAVSHSDHRIWYLHIRDVRESDRGWYMCQINTEPMISQVGFVNVVVPPDILDHPTSSDMVVREGSSVILKCAATGYPKPNIVWKREEAKSILLDSGDEVSLVEGSEFHLNRVTRLHMGPYLCIASNGVPPTVSKRIMLIVQFPPMIWIQNQLVGASEKQEVTLECYSEAYPKSINYWTKDDGRIITQGAKYEPHMDDNAYKVHMKLTIRAVSATDFGSYKCISKNSLGETDGTIKLYHVPSTSPPSSVTKATEILSSRRSNIRDGGNSVHNGYMEDGRHTKSKDSPEQAVLAGTDHLLQNGATSAKTIDHQLTVISSTSATNARSFCTTLFSVSLISIFILNI